MEAFPQIPDSVKLEHDVARILQQQEAHGWRFDTRSAWELASTLRRELQETEELLRRKHPYVEEQSSLLNEITKHKATSKVLPSLD